ncbi:MAG: hypothetical protein E7812_11995 [Phenylobacterium sp.]|nr:MAG: hypothetical protein E7812_11995 [Phenylobacterium sp.]
MTLVDQYLRAVSILLPMAHREDIVAELRDTILSRIEAREEELGRPLTDDETEAVLREVGHPLVVAARYREGPQHVVGPAIYPYWAFAVKVGVAIQVAVAVLVLFGRALAGGDFAYALGRAIDSAVGGILVLVGVATVVAWLIERQGFRIGYFETWRVRDLRFLEFAAWDWDTLRDWLAGRGWPGQPYWSPSSPPSSPSSRSSSSAPSGPRSQPQRPQPSPRPQPRPRAQAAAQPEMRTYAPPPPSPPRAPLPPWQPPPHWSPVGRGVVLLVGGAVLVLWWISLLRYDLGVSPGALRAAGFEPGPLASVNWEALRASLFWPFLAYGLGIILRGVFHLAHPWAVRLQGFLEASSGAAVAAFGVWLWNASPLSAAVRVDGFADLAWRLSAFQDHMVPMSPLATIAVAMLIVIGLSVMVHGLWDMLFGAPPPEPWPAGISAWPEAPR